MSVLIPEKDLPADLAPEHAVETAYATELAEVAGRLLRGLPALVECDKELAPYLYKNVRDRLKQQKVQCVYLDGRPRGDEPQGPVPVGLMGTMIAQLREAVRGAVEKKVVVLPHLDLLTTSQGGLTAEAREVIPLLYENPELVWLGFKDPSFPLPKVIENLFPFRTSLLGVARPRLRYLVTQREARKFGRTFNPWALYKHVSGVNAVRLRRLLSTLEGEDYPAEPRRAYRQLRQATIVGQLEVPDLDIDRDIGGYVKVKTRLRREILDVLTLKDRATDEEEIARLEELLPRGMIFWGPPGTGKTYFAKAMAAAIGAAVTVVSGPELKSRWVGESLPWDEEVFVILNGRARRMPIGELVDGHAPGDRVLTWTVRDDGRALLAPVTSFLRHRGPNYVDVLLTETGRQVRVTGGHSLFVNQDGRLGEVFAEEVNPGETRVAVPLRLTAPETIRELDLLDLLAGRADVRVQGYDGQLTEAVERLGSTRAGEITGVAVRKLRWNYHRPRLRLADFERVMHEAGIEPDARSLTLYCWHRKKALPAVIPLTEDWGEFLGRWVADGCYARTGVRISCHTDEADQVEGLCRRLFGHVTRYAKAGRGVDFVLNHTLLRYVMRDGLGLPDGAGQKRVPPVIFLAPRPVVAAFLRGYFSGDGTFSGKYIEATTVSRGLANDILTLLQYFGIAARCSAKTEWNGSTSYRLRFMWEVFLRRFAAEIGFTDPRRCRALEAYLGHVRSVRTDQTPEPHITNDVLWDLVVARRREPYSREAVYDLGVPRTERFVAGFGNVLVHNSEENLRQIFHRARQSAPSIIVFDELDSFASARGTYTGSGVEHSMVNQLLTEMDGFRSEELVFVVGTTNFVEILDPALLRPGRFEFHLHIPYPEAEDRREILKIYDRKMRLRMTEEALEYAVRRTADFVEGAAEGTRYSGDHLNALCRSIARFRLRDGRQDETTPADVDRALTEYVDMPTLSPREELRVAVHESGHAVCSLFCEHSMPIERITIKSETSWALGYVRYKDDDRKFITTQHQLRDDLCVLMGGREAEQLLLGDLATGSMADIHRATEIAHALVEVLGMGGDTTGVRQYRKPDEKERRPHISEEQRAAIDRRVNQLLEEARQRAAAILHENKAVLEALRDLLLEKKTIDAKALTGLVKK
jgi:ATP-dependent Zn protease/intein/homing endonuclease